MACSQFILPNSGSSITPSTLTYCRPLCLPFAIHLRLARFAGCQSHLRMECCPTDHRTEGSKFQEHDLMGGHEHQRYPGIMACIKMRGFLRCRICRHTSLASAWPPNSFSSTCRSSPVLIVCLHFYGLKELLRSLGRLYGSFSRRNEGHRENGLTCMPKVRAARGRPQCMLHHKGSHVLQWPTSNFARR